MAFLGRDLRYGLRVLRLSLGFTIVAILTLAVVAALASFIPSYRASKLDPVVALREE
jgi:ABC-type lipoprotein release transport system permease subunit